MTPGSAAARIEKQLTRGAGAYQADDAGGGEAFVVDHPVNLVMQATNNTCWAASCAMLLDQSEQDVIDAVGSAGGDGADEPEMQLFAGTLGLTIVPPMSMPIVVTCSVALRVMVHAHSVACTLKSQGASRSTVGPSH